MIVANCVDVTVEVEAANVPPVAPVAIRKLVGTETIELLVPNAMPAPSSEATTPERPTVQMLDAPPVTVVGVHWSEESVRPPEGSTVSSVVADPPPYVAAAVTD